MPSQFIDNLKREAEANPTMALAVGAALITATAKLIDAHGRHKGSAAYLRYARLAEQRTNRTK